jgi:hypothetical protein
MANNSIKTAPNTRSPLVGKDGKNRTGVSLSTNILIYAGTTPVGAIQKIDIDEARPSIKQVDEVGTDGHIDSCPTGSVNVTGSCERIRFNRLRMAEAFGRGFIHVAAQQYPFDLYIYDIQNVDPPSAFDSGAPTALTGVITTVIKNVWIKNIRYSYSATEWVIADSMSWEAETIYSYMDNEQNVAQGGATGISYYNNEFERQADRGDRRGALDAPGLINLLNWSDAS